jgi:hypothetical protein
MLTKAQNWARDCVPPDVLLANTLSTYVTKMGQTFHKSYDGKPPLCSGTENNKQPVTEYTLRNWTPSPQMLRDDAKNMIDYPVIELARGVPLDRLPTGDNRRLLTRVVEEVIRTNDHELMLSQVADYVVVNKIDLGLEPMPGNADNLAIKQLIPTIDAYRKGMLEYVAVLGDNSITFN